MKVIWDKEREKEIERDRDTSKSYVIQTRYRKSNIKLKKKHYQISTVVLRTHIFDSDTKKKIGIGRKA